MTLEITEDGFDSFVDSHDNVVIDCWAPWCGPCRRLGPIIDEISAEYADKVAVAKLNVDEAQVISMRFGIQAIPTVLFFKKGVLVNTMVGLRPKEDIVAIMQGAKLLE